MASILILWVITLVCMAVMKKIQPQNSWYTVYAITIATVVTWVLSEI
ncbi:hypothetical protein ACSKF1_05800 [Lactiplantibacillus plantarum]